MEDLKTLFSDPWFQTINFIFAIIGVIASYIQIKSHFEQKRKDKIFETLFSKAETEWEGKYNAEQVNLLKQELSNLQLQVNEEKDKIQKEIPLRAKEYFLKEQLYSIDNNISDLYKTSLLLKKELKNIDTSQPNKDKLDNLIEEEIRPNYLRNERYKKFLYYSVLFLVSINLIPYLYYVFSQKVESPFGETILLVLVEPIIILFLTFYLTYKFENKRIIKFNTNLTYRVIFIIVLIISVLIFIIASLLIPDLISQYKIRRFDSKLLQSIFGSIIMLFVPSYFIALTTIYFINHYRRK